MIVLADSDILIEVSRARNADIYSAFRSLLAGPDTVGYSPVSAAELWAGAWPREFEATSELFRVLTCIPIDYTLAEIAGSFLRTFAKSHSLEVPDTLIAASAVHAGALLWTRNRKQYPMPEIHFYEM